MFCGGPKIGHESLARAWKRTSFSPFFSPLSMLYYAVAAELSSTLPSDDATNDDDVSTIFPLKFDVKE